MITERIYNADDAEFDELFDDEKKQTLELRNSDGEKLVYIGNNIWVAESAVMSKEDEEAYEKRYSHPKISVGKTLLQLLLPPSIVAAAAVLVRFTAGAYVEVLRTPGWLILFSAGVLLLYSFVRARSIIVFAVHVYQAKAPMEVRRKCAMTPTCSDYMIRAVRKYGAIRGVIKGIGRLRRCNGTRREDWP